ncbi:MAG: HXXEE domain-containing protein [Anaerolineae bacterium]|nr:HXXEE domain-containing protein [Anaerolineae bacterium]
MSANEMMSLLPLVFMLHDFEEIIMMPAWLQRQAETLKQRLPPRIQSLMSHSAGLSTAAFSLAVAEEFLLLSVLSTLAIHFAWTAFWLGLMLAFFIHLLVHIGQFIWFKAYTPAILTSLPAGLYCLWVLWLFKNSLASEWQAVLLFTLLGLAIVVINLVLALRLGKIFDVFLATYIRAL